MRRKFRNKSARYFSTGKSMSVNKTPRKRANNVGDTTWETSEFIDILLSNPDDDLKAIEVVKQEESYGTTLVDVFKDSLHYDPSLNLDNVDWAYVIEFYEQTIEENKLYHGISAKRASEAPFSNDQAVVNTALSFLNDRFGGQWNELRFWYRDDILEELEKYLSGHPAEDIIADVHAYLTYDMAFEEPQAIRDEMFPNLLTHALRHFGGNPSAAAGADESEIEEALYETLDRFYYEDKNLYNELRTKFFEHIGKTSNLNTERKNAMNGRNRKSPAANRRTASSDFWSALNHWDDVIDIYVESNRNGSLEVSAMIGGYREKKVFFDYSVEEAVDIFADEHSLSRPVRGGFFSARKANRKTANKELALIVFDQSGGDLYEEVSDDLDDGEYEKVVDYMSQWDYGDWEYLEQESESNLIGYTVDVGRYVLNYTHTRAPFVALYVRTGDHSASRKSARMWQEGGETLMDYEEAVAGLSLPSGSRPRIYMDYNDQILAPKSLHYLEQYLDTYGEPIRYRTTSDSMDNIADWMIRPANRRANRKRAYSGGEMGWENVADGGDPIYGSSGHGPDGNYYSFYVYVEGNNLVFEAQNEDTMDPKEYWIFEHDGDIPSGDRLIALGDAMAIEFERGGAVSDPINGVPHTANRKRANIVSLDDALQEVANDSFYGAKQIIPEGDGYRVEDDYGMNTEDWEWTYDQGVMDTDSVSETSRLMESYESFSDANHIRYNMPESVEALENGQTVTFAYALVSDADAIFDEETQEYYDADGDPTDDVAGWILTADWF